MHSYLPRSPVRSKGNDHNAVVSCLTCIMQDFPNLMNYKRFLHQKKTLRILYVATRTIMERYLLLVGGRSNGRLLEWRGCRMVGIEVAPLALGLLWASHAAPAQALGHIIRRYLLQMHLHRLYYLQLDWLQRCGKSTRAPGTPSLVQ
jgi:hypothetical protein